MSAHTTRTEEEKLKLAAEVIDYLNEVLKIDPDAIHSLIETRVACNDALGDHATTQVGRGPSVGLLGILNGLVGARASDQWGFITANYETEGGSLISFEPTVENPTLVEDQPDEMHPDVGDKPVLDVDAAMLIRGNRRKFVERVQYYLNELLDDDNPHHVIGHIESECADYTKLIRDAVKVYGTGYPKT